MQKLVQKDCKLDEKLERQIGIKITAENISNSPFVYVFSVKKIESEKIIRKCGYFLKSALINIVECWFMVV